MNYYYDILVNLSYTTPFEFYEWLDTDVVEHIKKIPLFRVSSRVIRDFHLYHITLDKELTKQVYLKTESLQGKYDYMLLLTDTKCALVVEASASGEVICLSKLLLNEELNLLEIACAFDEEVLLYEKGKKREEVTGFRIETQIKKFILSEITSLYKENSLEKLKYIYYEWTGTTAYDKETIYNNLKILIEQDFDTKHYEIYKLIKLSYQKNL